MYLFYSFIYFLIFQLKELICVDSRKQAWCEKTKVLAKLCGWNYFSLSAQNLMMHCRADGGSLIASQISVRLEKRFDLTIFLAAGFRDCGAT